MFHEQSAAGRDSSKMTMTPNIAENFFTPTISYKIFETDSSFYVK